MRGNSHGILELAGTPECVAKACNVDAKEVYKWLVQRDVPARHLDNVIKLAKDNGFLIDETAQADSFLMYYCVKCKRTRPGGAFWGTKEDHHWYCAKCVRAMVIALSENKKGKNSNEEITGNC